MRARGTIAISAFTIAALGLIALLTPPLAALSQSSGPPVLVNADFEGPFTVRESGEVRVAEGI